MAKHPVLSRQHLVCPAYPLLGHPALTSEACLVEISRKIGWSTRKLVYLIIMKDVSGIKLAKNTQSLISKEASLALTFHQNISILALISCHDCLCSFFLLHQYRLHVNQFCDHHSCYITLVTSDCTRRGGSDFVSKTKQSRSRILDTLKILLLIINKHIF